MYTDDIPRSITPCVYISMAFETYEYAYEAGKEFLYQDFIGLIVTFWSIYNNLKIL